MDVLVGRRRPQRDESARCVASAPSAAAAALVASAASSAMGDGIVTQQVALELVSDVGDGRTGQRAVRTIGPRTRCG